MRERILTDWWNEPYRLLQTNLRLIDATLDPRHLIDRVEDLHANAVLFNVGGIFAFYPTDLPLHQPNPYLQGDVLAEVIEEAHRRDVKVVGRFDLSKAGRRAYEQHPDWFVKTVEGRPVAYEGQYHTCVNGGWQREYSKELLREALGRYEVDGLFFNMFGYQTRDYSGNYYGICQCGNCQARFAEMYGEQLPVREDLADPVFRKYVQFKRITAGEVAAQTCRVIRDARPGVGIMLRHDDSDILRMEVNRALDRPLPEWVHGSGEQARWGAAFGRGKPYMSAIVHFIDIPYRYVAETPACGALRLAQNLANGAQLDYYVVGTLDQDDEEPYDVVRDIFALHERHAELYRNGRPSQAQVALYHSRKSGELYPGGMARGGTRHFRGAYRILAEDHIPFDLISDDRMGDDDAAEQLARYDVIVLPNAACLSDDECRLLDDYVRQGGHLIATHESSLYDETGTRRDGFGLQSLGATRAEERREDTRGAYFHADGHLPDLAKVKLLLLDETYVFAEARQDAEAIMPMIPPQKYGPPELAFAEMDENGRYGGLLRDHGQGSTAYLPWQPDALYYRHSLKEYRSLIGGLVRRFAGDPVVVVDAPRQLEVSVHTSTDGAHTLVHLVNFSGAQGNAYHDPVTAHGVRVGVRVGDLPTGSARALVADQELTVKVSSADDVSPGAVSAAGSEAQYAVVEVPPVGHFEAIAFSRG